MNEKITDFIRKQFEKMTGYVLPRATRALLLAYADSSGLSGRRSLARCLIELLIGAGWAEESMSIIIP